MDKEKGQIQVLNVAIAAKFVPPLLDWGKQVGMTGKAEFLVTLAMEM